MDREDVLFKAEKLVRQGRLNLAITEYKRVVDEYPQDWSTANTLGDLYLRAQQPDKAVEQYLRIADHLAEEGFLPRATALYKKALKIKPGDGHALERAAEIAVRQGLLAEAKQHYHQLVAGRRAAGDRKAVAEALMRIAALDPDDLDARLAAARAVADAGQTDVAAGELVTLADELDARGRTSHYLAALEEALQLTPENAAIRLRAARACAEHGQPARARQHARTADDFRDLASVFSAAGDESAELMCLADVVRLDPGDADAAARLVRAYMARGDIVSAQPYLAPAGQSNDAGALLLVGEVLARLGKVEDARGVFTRLLARAPHLVSDVLEIGIRLVTEAPAGGLASIEAAASIHLLNGDFKAAADGYERLLRAHPSNLTALMCLVELCVEGGLDEQLAGAQTRLVEAYLQHGHALEARAVAEDLAARTQDPSHVAMFRQTLEAMGEANPDLVVAERLGQQEAAADTSLAGPYADLAAQAPADGAAEAVDSEPPAAVEPPAPIPTEPVAAADPFRLGPIAIDLRGILGDALDRDTGPIEPVSTGATHVTESSKPQPTPVTARGDRTDEPAPAGADRVFADFHEEVSRQAETQIAEQHYKVALAYRDMGMLSEAIGELEVAVRSPRLRFEAASLLARLLLQRGAVADAIEWFERAAEAPAPSAEAARSLLYELGDTLEIAGESARALAVFLELHAEAGEYRDVARRVERLSRVQTGG